MSPAGSWAMSPIWLGLHHGHDDPDVRQRRGGPRARVQRGLAAHAETAPRRPATSAPDARRIAAQRRLREPRPRPFTSTLSPSSLRRSPSPAPRTAPALQIRVGEPWPGYRHLKARDVIDRLASGPAEELAAVELFELAGAHRKSAVVAAAERGLKKAAAPRRTDRRQLSIFHKVSGPGHVRVSRSHPSQRRRHHEPPRLGVARAVRCRSRPQPP